MKVLIFTASTGGGHKRAAAALKETIENISEDNEVMIVDGIALSGKLYNLFVCEGYTLLAKKAPVFYGKIYVNSDKKSPLNSLCNSANKIRGHKILPLIEEYNPDIIVSCHAFVTTMLGNLKKHKKINVPVVALVTDFAPHRTYLAKGIEHYVVSSNEMVDIFSNKYNFDTSTVYSYGIPVFEKFAQQGNKAELCKKLNLNPDLPIILFMAGSFGVNEVLEVYENISKKCTHCQFVVITGNNSKLYHRFENVISEKTKLLMFVNNVEDYMHVSSLIITKPGGLTVSESLQCNLPMAIYSAFPGQEAENASYLVRSGVAVLLDKNPGNTVKELLDNKDKLNQMKENCKKIRNENSSEKIFRLMEQLVKKNRNNEDNV